MEDRFTEPGLRGTVIAKTGTLPSKRASALVGAVYSKDRGVILFAILNRDTIIRARHRQDDIVTEILLQSGGGSPNAIGRNAKQDEISSNPAIIVPPTQSQSLR
jgi:hypothetical protein